MTDDRMWRRDFIGELALVLRRSGQEAFCSPFMLTTKVMRGAVCKGALRAEQYPDSDPDVVLVFNDNVLEERVGPEADRVLTLLAATEPWHVVGAALAFLDGVETEAGIRQVIDGSSAAWVRDWEGSQR